MPNYVKCPQCPWSGMDHEIMNDGDPDTCPRCGVSMDAPVTMTPLSNYILFALTLNLNRLNRGTKWEK